MTATQKLQELTLQKNNFESVFTSQTFDEVIKIGESLPAMQQLFGSLLHTGELCIFFGDNGLGKSILAVQIGYAIANGKKILELNNESEPLVCLYYDFELTARNYAKRYHNKTTQQTFYDFGKNFIRQEIEVEKINYDDSFTELIEKSIYEDIEKHNAQCIIIDNIVALSLKSTSDNSEAINLMRRLDKLKKEKNITIIVLAHTPKIISGSPIKKEHLAGAKQLSDFSDTMISIGKSTKNEKMRYLIQLKSRNEECYYDSKNVIECQLVQKDNGFLCFEFVDFGIENDHLKDEQSLKDEIISQIKELKKSNPDMSFRDIAKQVGKSKDFVSKILKK